MPSETTHPPTDTSPPSSFCPRREENFLVANTLWWAIRRRRDASLPNIAAVPPTSSVPSSRFTNELLPILDAPFQQALIPTRSVSRASWSLFNLASERQLTRSTTACGVTATFIVVPAAETACAAQLGRTTDRFFVPQQPQTCRFSTGASGDLSKSDTNPMAPGVYCPESLTCASPHSGFLACWSLLPELTSKHPPNIELSSYPSAPTGQPRIHPKESASSQSQCP